eukprot:gene8947-18169_t
MISANANPSVELVQMVMAFKPESSDILELLDVVLVTNRGHQLTGPTGNGCGVVYGLSTLSDGQNLHGGPPKGTSLHTQVSRNETGPYIRVLARCLETIKSFAFSANDSRQSGT